MSDKDFELKGMSLTPGDDSDRTDNIMSRLDKDDLQRAVNAINQLGRDLEYDADIWSVMVALSGNMLLHANGVELDMGGVERQDREH
jgi:hypothetical protein